jgi:hypothetical protein
LASPKYKFNCFFKIVRSYNNIINLKLFIFPINSLFLHNQKKKILEFDKSRKIYKVNNIISSNSNINMKKQLNLYFGDANVFIGLGQIIKYNLLKILKIVT